MASMGERRRLAALVSSKRAIRRRSCTGKQRHTSLEAVFAARRAIMRASKAEAGSLNVYRCAFCGGFHVGHRKGSGLRAS